MRPLTPNILKIWDECSAEEIAAGIEWYGRARRLAEELNPLDPAEAAAVIALQSPLVKWELNVKLARKCYELARAGATFDEIVAGLRGGFKANARKAAAVVLGADPNAVVSGPKVTPFWLTIVNPLDSGSVVIDRHAIDIAWGRVTDDATRSRFLAKRGNIQVAQRAYVRAAAILSAREGREILPSDVQAVTWERWRVTRVKHRESNKRARSLQAAA